MALDGKPAKQRAASRSRVLAKARDTTADGSLQEHLAEALEQQRATTEILRAIAGSPGDVQPVFDTIAKSAARLCGAQFCHVFRFDDELLHFVASHGVAAEGIAALRRAYPMAPSQGSAAARSILNGAIEQIPDVDADAKYAHGPIATIVTFRSVVAVPMLRNGQPIGSIAVARSEAGLFPERQIELLRTFADQAVIAIENARLIAEVETRNRALTASLEQQTATSEILRVISSARTDEQPVFDTIAANALRLCKARFSSICRFDGELIHLVAFHNLHPAGAAAFHTAYPCPPHHGGSTQRAILTRNVVHMPDTREESDYRYHDVAEAADYRSVLSVPMLHEGQAIGSVSVYGTEPQPFPDSQIELLKTFADQAVIAVENVRLFTELEARNAALTESLEQQTATSEILRVISQSPTKVQPVFDTIVAAARTLCRASAANVFTFDGELVHLAASANVNSDYMRQLFPRPPSRDTAVLRAIQTRSVVMIDDVLNDPEYVIAPQAAPGGVRSVLAVPLLREGTPIGGIAVGRPEPGTFPSRQITLLQTFADQAVIAIENVRLFNETKEGLEQQTATSEILRVISQSPTDVQPVFDTIVAATMKLCRATAANVFTFDGALIHVAALANLNPDYHAAIRLVFPRRPGRDTAVGRAILARKVVVIPDVLYDPEYAIGPQTLAGGFRGLLAVPLIRKERPIGAIIVGAPEPGPFPEKQIALLQTFADQAVIGIENVRLFSELKARTDQLTRSVGELRALGEVGQAVSSTLDLETVLSTIVSRAAQLAGMDGGSIWEYDEEREEFYLHATDRLPEELVEVLRAAPIRKGEGALGRLALTGEPVEIRSIGDEPSYPSRVREILIRCGYSSILAVPLLREDHLLGALAVNRSSAGVFAPEIIDWLKTFATQSTLAIQNARLFREIEAKSRELESASRHKSEFLANMSHELRTPLNAIIGFSEVLAERMFGDLNDKQVEYLSDILESARHLLSLINDILDLSKIEAGRMELEPTDFDLRGLIENTLTLVRERAHRRNIALAFAVDERLGVIRADERKVKQVLLNLLSNALKFTPEGGQINVRAGLRKAEAEIAVSDTGVGIAHEDQAAVFEEFRQVGANSGKVEGTGLGLAISRKFVELHGGRIGLESQVGKGSTFTFTLPQR